MSFIKPFFKFGKSVIYDVRKEYNLHKPGAMDQAVDILQDWVRKQEHFVKKDFPREYLEGFIIASKGSVEKAKTSLDRLCTMRTMTPSLFQYYNVKKDFPKLREFCLNVVVPAITEDNCRIHVVKMISKTVIAATCLQGFQRHEVLCEYSKLHDYAKGYYTIIDVRDVSMVDAMANLNMIDVRNLFQLITEGHGLRIMGVYVISNSNIINALVSIVRPFLSSKICDRARVVKNVEALYDFLPMKLLPKDYGGDQKSTSELHDEIDEVLCTDEHLTFMKEMKDAYTNEKLRSSDKFSQDYLDPKPGSFKSLSVD